MRKSPLALAAAAVFAVAASFGANLATAQPVEPILRLAQGEKAATLKTLEELVNFESGSKDIEGLDKLADYIAARLKALGGQVELLEAKPEDIYRMHDTPPKLGKMVKATFMGNKGASGKKILLIAHMDTVYLKGMLAKQPFRIDGNRAYGLGIADDKGGVAIILHTLAVLQKANFKDYGQITVLINGDEEISSPGSRNTLTQLGSEHDAVFSCESTSVTNDRLSLATAGIGAVTLSVKGRASHAGSAPHLGVNALYELSHQIMQMRDLSKPAVGLKLNWTVAQAGTNRNVIPAEAQANADVRVLSVADYDGIEKAVAERIKNKLLPESEVKMVFERRRPPLEPSEAGRRIGAHAKNVYKEIGRDIAIVETAEGGGTDAAFASLKAKGAVIERFGLAGFGAHSNDAEYVSIDSIEPRLYLLVRMVMDVGSGKVQ
jgi:glutamate carboxypeptidase